MVEWEAVRADFQWDGSLRDLYVFGTSDEKWDRFLVALQSWGYPTQFSVEGKPSILPESARSVFQIRNRASPLLRIDVGGVGLCCHFFSEEELELDLDPRDVDGPARLGQLMSFMQKLGQVLQLPVVLTPENRPECAVMTYDPVSDRTSHRAPGGAA